MSKLDHERSHQELRDLVLGIVDQRAILDGWGEQPELPPEAVLRSDWMTQAAPRAYERLPIWLFGHSWTGGRTLSWWERTGTRLGAQVVETHGVGGTKAADAAMANLRAPYVHAWDGRYAGLCFGVSTINDNYWKNSDAASLRCHAIAWKTLVAIYAQGTIIGASALTATGTWTTDTITPVLSGSGVFQDAADGTRRTSSTVGDYVETSVTVTSAGVVDAILIHPAAGGGTVTLSIDGTVRATYAMTDTLTQDTPAVLTATGISAGAHTARLTVTAGTVSVDSIRVRTATPPALVILCEKYPTTPGNNSQGHADRLDEMYASIIAAAATSPAASVCNLNDYDNGYNAATMWRTDGAHFNNQGQGWAADQIMRHLWEKTFVPELDINWRPPA